MIPYSISTDVRAKVHFALAALAIAGMYALGLASHAASEILPPSLLTLSDQVKLPSAFATYGILLWLFDKYIWRWRLFVMLHGIPDLNGQWEGTVDRQEGVAAPVQRPVKAVIIQNWNTIEIEMEGTSSRSSAKSASMFLKDRASMEMMYCYAAVPKLSGTGENKYGEGLQNLKLSLESSLVLSGRYFSSKHRGGFTTLKLVKKL